MRVRPGDSVNDAHSSGNVEIEVESIATAHQTTAIGSYGFSIARALEASGVDSGRVFDAAGIAKEFSADPLSRLSTAQITRLYRACVDVTNNPYFGLVVARFMQLSTIHALGFGLAASASLMDFCRRLQRYIRLASEVAAIDLIEAGGHVHLRFRHLVEACGETEDAFMGFVVLTMRSLYKPTFKPIAIELRRPMPFEGAEPYEQLTGAPVTFSNICSTFVFDRADMTHPLSGACAELAQVNDGIVINYLAKLDKSNVVIGVTKKIIELLPEGDCSRDRVAGALCMSSSNLQLKLLGQGTNFHQLLDDTRKELGCSYVLQPARSVTEITFLLGFANTSNFTRAFKRWTGSSPTEFRITAR